jgi:hypothetical protein
MAWYADLIEHAMELANTRVDLLCQVTRIHCDPFLGDSSLDNYEGESKSRYW